jgi:hypothetical protein
MTRRISIISSVFLNAQSPAVLFQMRLPEPHRPLQQTQPGNDSHVKAHHSKKALDALTTVTLVQFVLPEMIAHAFMTTLFLLSFQVIAFLLNAPLLAYNVNKYVWSLSSPPKFRPTLPSLADIVRCDLLTESSIVITCLMLQKSSEHWDNTRRVSKRH